MKDLSESCTLLACQISIPTIRSFEAKLAHVDDVLERIAKRLDDRRSDHPSACPADLVVLPELSLVEYSRASFDLLSELAESLDGPSVMKIAAMAKKYDTAFVFGMPRVDANSYFISQVVVDASGEVIGCYDKLHICQYGASMEKEYFYPGRCLSHFDINGLRFAPIICYDIRIPELSRTLTLDHGVDCILHCGAYFRDESFSTWHAFVTTRAMENQIYIVSLNRAGADYGESIFCPPWIDETRPSQSFQRFDEDFQFLTITRSSIDAARSGYTFLKDKLNQYDDLELWEA